MKTPKPRETTDRDMRIYLMHARDTDRYKIGVTCGDPERRRLEIQTGCPYIVDLLLSLKTPDAYKVERHLHNDYSQFHVHGEWFAFPSSETNVESVKQAALKYARLSTQKNEIPDHVAKEIKKKLAYRYGRHPIPALAKEYNVPKEVIKYMTFLPERRTRPLVV